MLLLALAEIVNLRNLERVLAREEEVKKRAIVHKAVYSGPQIRYFSKNGKLLLFIFESFLDMQLLISINVLHVIKVLIIIITVLCQFVHFFQVAPI